MLETVTSQDSGCWLIVASPCSRIRGSKRLRQVRQEHTDHVNSDKNIKKEPAIHVLTAQGVQAWGRW